MADSRAPAVWTALYDTVRAADALATTTPPANVWFGPVVTGDPTDSIYIGYDGDPEGEMAAIVGDQDWAGTLGAKQRDETFDIVCSITVLAGDGDVAAAVARVYALFAIVTQAVRTNTCLGQPPPTVVSIRSPQLYLDPTAQGLEPRLVFRVNVKTRI